MSGTEGASQPFFSPDGQWVVGLSGSRGFLHAVNTTNVYSIATPDGAGSSVVSGVGYRTRDGQKEVIMAGLSSGWNSDFMTTNGTTFGNKRRDVNLGKAPAAVVANGVAGTASDVFYSTWWDGKANNNQIPTRNAVAPGWPCLNPRRRSSRTTRPPHLANPADA